jgi:hypothetical protein
MFDKGEIDPEIDQLSRGLVLFEQLKNVDSASAALRAVNEGGLSEDDLRAIVLFQVFNFRQQADDADSYGAWSSS